MTEKTIYKVSTIYPKGFLLEIVDDNQNPIKGVEFSYVVDNSNSKKGTTDDRGILNVSPVPKNEVLLSIGKEVTQEELRGDLGVLVVDNNTNQPIPDAIVSAIGPESPPSSVSDEKGIVIFNDLQAGDYSITASKPDFSSDTQQVTVIEGGSVSAGPWVSDSNGARSFASNSEGNSSELDADNPGAVLRLSAKPSISASIEAIYFRLDHVFGNAPHPYPTTTPPENRKLLRPSQGDMGDATSIFNKPEWTPNKSDPVSYTMGTDVVLDLVLDLKVNTPNGKGRIKSIRGVSSDAPFNYERVFDTTKEESAIVTGEKIIYWLLPKLKLPLNIEPAIRPLIQWYVQIDGIQNEIDLGETDHKVLVTLDRPIGKLEADPGGFRLRQSGRDQDVTVERLELALLYAQHTSIEKNCVDEIFKSLSSRQHYSLNNRWPEGPTLHHYMWKLVDGTAVGECDILAAAFILCCRMAGVIGKMAIGKIYPWGRRDALPPHQIRPNPKRGKYNNSDNRNHIVDRTFPIPDENHDEEQLCFLDGKGRGNNFEGVACYLDQFLYGIGENIPEEGGTADENAHRWYEKANFDLFFARRNLNKTMCDRPYFNIVNKPVFTWSD